MITVHLMLLATITGLALLLWVASVFALRWLRHAYLAKGAHTLEIHAPPTTTIDHAQAFWTTVLGLLRPRWTHRLLAPHLAWEYVASQRGVRIQLWIPGTVNVGAIERAVAADWPGATTHRLATTSSIPHGAHTFGKWMGMARGDHYPLRTKFTDDPLRNLFGELSDLSPGQHALVRICARPAPARRAARVRDTAARLRGLHTPLTPHTGSRTTVLPGITDDVRAILTKASTPRLACQISVLLTTEHANAQARQRLRGRNRSVAATLAAYTSGLNSLRRRWMPFPALWANRRYLACGYLLSTTELAAIAHLPTDPAVPGLTRAGARRVAPNPTCRAPEVSASSAKPTPAPDDPSPTASPTPGSTPTSSARPAPVNPPCWPT